MAKFGVTSKNPKPLRKGVFWVSFIFFVIVLAYGSINPDGFSAILNNIMTAGFATFGWAIQIVCFGGVVLLLALMISPWGSKKLGGEDAVPTMSTWKWFSIVLCAGIGIGICFWGVAEPIIHYSTPPASMGLEPYSADAAVWAIKTAFHHWTLTPYTTYLVFGLGIAYAAYNLNKPMAVSSCLQPVLGDKGVEKYGGIVDTVAVIGIVGGVSHSLGLGVMQLSNGTAYITGNDALASSKLVWVIWLVIIIGCYTLSSYSGIEKGITFLSQQNVRLYIFILIFLVITGPAQFMADIGTEALGYFISDFVGYSTWMGFNDLDGTMGSDSWVGGWPIFYYGIFLAYGPAVGIFIARIGYGRTIRSFIFCNLLGPTIVAVIWFSIFGGGAIYIDAILGKPLAEAVNADFSVAIYAFLEYFPLSKVMMIVMMVIAAVSFITIADSMSTATATMCTSGHTLDDQEPPAKMKIVWAFIMGGGAFIGILAGGVQPIKIIGTLAGFPIAVIFLVACVGLILFAMNKEWKIGFKKKEEPEKPAEVETAS